MEYLPLFFFFFFPRWLFHGDEPSRKSRGAGRGHWGGGVLLVYLVELVPPRSPSTRQGMRRPLLTPFREAHLSLGTSGFRLILLERLKVCLSLQIGSKPAEQLWDSSIWSRIKPWESRIRPSAAPPERLCNEAVLCASQEWKQQPSSLTPDNCFQRQGLGRQLIMFKRKK